MEVGGCTQERESATFLWAAWTLSSNLLCVYSSVPSAEILGYKVIHTFIEHSRDHLSDSIFGFTILFTRYTFSKKSSHTFHSVLDHRTTCALWNP